MTLLLFLSKPYTFLFVLCMGSQYNVGRSSAGIVLGRSSDGQQPYLLPDSSIHTNFYSNGPIPTYVNNRFGQRPLMSSLLLNPIGTCQSFPLLGII